MDLRPVDLSALDQPQASRWAVVYPCDDFGHWHEAYFRERPAADAYAALHRGAIIVRMVNLDPFPQQPRG